MGMLASRPRSATALPNLVIIGAAKCGTTSLHHYLASHPEISMAAPVARAGLLDNDAAGKEMRFFWREDWRDRIDWYCSHFACMTTPIRGEATPAYSAYPFHPGVAERIYRTVPEARLIYVVGDPIERIVAHYVQQRADGDRRTFAERMRAYNRPDSSIVCPSLYATQIEQYLQFFPTSQLLVVDQHDLRHERRDTLRRIFEFLEVDRDFWSPVFVEERNTRAHKYELTTLSGRVFDRCIDPCGRRLAPARWSTLRGHARRALARTIVDRPVVDDELRARLTAHLAPEVRRLRELTGASFPNWSL
jgi:hypothetical protein